MFAASQLAASMRTEVVSSWTSERLPPMTPAIDVGPAASAMRQISASAIRVWSSSVTTCSPSVARRTTSRRALDPVEVEGVHRLAGEQHHVVRDVDDVVDRALAAGHEARLQPRRRRAELDVVERAGGEARAEVGRLDDDLHADIALPRARVLGPRRRRQRRAGRRMRLARDAVDGQAVRPVGRDLELEHVGRDRQHAGERDRRSQPVVEHHRARVVHADAELVLGEDHPVGLLAAQLGLLELRAVGHDRAGPRDGDGLPGRDVRRAADDLRLLAPADVDDADRQAIGVGVLLRAQRRGRRRSAPARRTPW